MCGLPNFDGISLITRISQLKSSVCNRNTFKGKSLFVLQRINVIFFIIVSCICNRKFIISYIITKMLTESVFIRISQSVISVYFCKIFVLNNSCDIDQLKHKYNPTLLSILEDFQTCYLLPRYLVIVHICYLKNNNCDMEQFPFKIIKFKFWEILWKVLIPITFA